MEIFAKASDGLFYPLAATSPVAATQTLTLVANPSNGDTFTVGGRTYTFQTVLTNVAGNVFIGASASISLDNAIAAINRAVGDGSLYATATAQNPNVSAAAGAGDTMVVTSRVTGTGGNSIAATETFTNGGNVWGAATLSGGTNAILKVENTTSTGEPGATEAKQDTQITAEQAILAKLPTVGTASAPSANVVTTQRPAVTQVVSTALEASKVLKASAGQLVQLSVFNSGPAQFILLMNSTTVPANGAVTLLFPPIPIATGQLLVLDIPSPLVASTGIAVSNSTTGTFTKTLGAADCVFYAQIN